VVAATIHGARFPDINFGDYKMRKTLELGAHQRLTCLGYNRETHLSHPADDQLIAIGYATRDGALVVITAAGKAYLEQGGSRQAAWLLYPDDIPGRP
jgi:hypothetical protein